MYDSIIFDLDGTLWDAAETCAKGWNVALQECGLDGVTVTADDIRSVSGLPFHQCVSTLFSGQASLDIDKLSQVIDREETRHIKLYGGDLYSGVIDDIAELSGMLPLFLISNCQDWYLESFWELYKLRSYFGDSDCHGRSGISKAEMIANMCQKHGLQRPIYIGDTGSDHRASQAAGVAFGLADYGFGHTEGADQSFSSFDELMTWCRKHSVSADEAVLSNEVVALL